MFLIALLALTTLAVFNKKFLAYAPTVAVLSFFAGSIFKAPFLTDLGLSTAAAWTVLSSVAIVSWMRNKHETKLSKIFG